MKAKSENHLAVLSKPLRFKGARSPVKENLIERFKATLTEQVAQKGGELREKQIFPFPPRPSPPRQRRKTLFGWQIEIREWALRDEQFNF